MIHKGLPDPAEGLSIVLCGPAGLGIQTVEYLLTRIFKLAGYNVFATKEYMSRVRGGMNSTTIRVSSVPVKAFVDRIDILVALGAGAIAHLSRRVEAETIVFGQRQSLESELASTSCRFFDVPLSQTALAVGDKIYSNTVATGIIAGVFGIELQMSIKFLHKYFAGKSVEVVQKNIQALTAGYEIGRQLVRTGRIEISIEKDAAVAEQILLGGAEAVGLGAIAGGCNFISSYPMSPSTPVLVFMAKHSNEFGIIAEQAEDEIAAMNMAIGAWYAGARAMVTTSGGGFALMTEGLSLAGMLESPMVIHLAQRPGPATGLPTRTEQADLELALYAGHGEFPRIILAPGKLADGFYLTQKAFNLADKYQMPVFVLTDQYFIDTYYNIPAPDLSHLKVEEYVTETKPDYRRYELTADGISARGIPGFGTGLVYVDSDEHTVEGCITEDLQLRVKMVDKRLKKLEAAKSEIIEPELVGPTNYKRLVICWGSTYNIVNEALCRLNRDDLAMLHYKQLYPLPTSTAEYLKKAQETIIVEANATGQFAKLIKLATGISIEQKILNYSGLSFTVEQVVESLEKLMKVYAYEH